MKIKIILLGMVVSLLLPLAGTYARIVPSSMMDMSGDGTYLTGQTADEQQVRRRWRWRNDWRSHWNSDKGSHGSKGSKDSKSSKDSKGSKESRGSKGSKGSKGSASPN